MNRKENILLKLLERSGPKFHGILLRITLDKEAAEELMQDLFVKLCQIRNLKTIENLEAYTARMAINLAFDWRRKQKYSFATLSENLHPFVQKPAISADNEELQQILNASEQLKGLTRECFALRYIEQMDYDRIAERTQKTTQQVRALCSKGIQRIRQILNEQNASFYKEAINE